MKDYGEEMRKDNERGWTEFQRKEKRRARLLNVLRLMLRFVVYAIGVAFMALLGAIVWICALFPDYECERIFKAIGLLWTR